MGGEGSSGRDPFDGWQLDEDFVNHAEHREGTAKERAAQQRLEDRRRRQEQRDADRWRRQEARRIRRGDSTEPWAYSSPKGSRRPWRGIVAVALVGLLLGWNAFVRDGGSSSGGVFGKQRDRFIVEGVVTDFPSPSAEAQSSPIGIPPPPPQEQGSYRFADTQSDGSSPIAYDPCRPIHVVVNGRTMPKGGEQLVQQALVDVSAATGLQFIVDGPTDEEPTDKRSPVDTERYGDRWAPVLIAWTDPDTYSDLVGDVAGFGGSQQISNGEGPTVLVTGTVSLDGPQFREILRSSDGEANALAIIRHELGHLVGLHHVDDESELMYPESSGAVTEYGPGDRTGLSLLGRGACRPDL